MQMRSPFFVLLVETVLSNNKCNFVQSLWSEVPYLPLLQGRAGGKWFARMENLC